MFNIDPITAKNSNGEQSPLFDIDLMLTISSGKCLAIVSELRELLKNGEIDPIETFIVAKKAMLLFSNLEDVAKKEIDLGIIGKEYSAFDVDMTTRQLGVKYDFTGCMDEEWDLLSDEMDILKAKIKQRESYLKNIKKPVQDIDEETGEVTVKLNPPVKTGATGIIATIK